MDANHALELLKKAMNITLDDVLLFTNNPINGIQAEYLLTVNVAKEIAKLNDYDANPYIISLEKKTMCFVRQCLPAILWGKPYLNDRLTDIQKLKERTKNTKMLNFKHVDTKHRNGKVDIVVYENATHGQFGEQPLCAIELKSFNPPKGKIIADLERNLFFLKLKANTGTSVLRYTLFAALHWNKKFNINENEKHKINLDKRYEEILVTLRQKNQDIIIRKEIFSLSKSVGTVEIEDIDIENDTAIESLDSSTKHHFMGVIVCFEKRI